MDNKKQPNPQKGNNLLIGWFTTDKPDGLADLPEGYGHLIFHGFDGKVQ